MTGAERMLGVMEKMSKKNASQIGTVQIGEVLDGSRIRVGKLELLREDYYMGFWMNRSVARDCCCREYGNCTKECKGKCKFSEELTELWKLKPGDLVAVVRVSEEMYVVLTKIV